MRAYKWYKFRCFIFIGLWVGAVMMFLKTKPVIKKLVVLHASPFMARDNTSQLSHIIQSKTSSSTFLQTDLYKLRYQLDYSLDFKRTPQCARLPQPPCRSFGEWFRNTCRRNSTENYVEYTLLDLLHIIDSTEEYIQSETRYLINGGANDGVANDPLYPLFTELGYPGIAIELSNELYEKLKVNLPASNITKLNVALEPHTVHQLFMDNRVPFRPLIMKMDIDGYDYTVVRSIFIHISNNSRTQYEPAFVMVEMNEKIPPPINFYTRYRPHYGYKSDHLYGASITAWTHLLSFELGYVLLGIYDWNNLIYIRYDLAQNLKLLYQFPHNSYDVWLHGYWNRPERNEKFPWNKNVQYWNDSNKTLLMKYRDVQNHLHSTKTFTDNVECSYFMDVRPVYIEP